MKINWYVDAITTPFGAVYVFESGELTTKFSTVGSPVVVSIVNVPLRVAPSANVPENFLSACWAHRPVTGSILE